MSRPRSRRLIFALVASLSLPAILTTSSPARAEPSLSDRETARSLMDDGDAKRDRNDLKGALKSYEAADAIMHVPTTGLEVARMQVQLGLLLEARETMGRVLRTPPKPGEPPAFAAARKQVEQLNAEVGARIPSVTVQVASGEPGQPVVVIFDGETVPPAAAQAPRKVNPGKHSVQVRSGSLEKSEEIVVNEKEAKTVTIDLKPSAVATSPAPSPPPDDTTPGRSPLPKILIFGGFGLGVVGVTIGAITGLSSISKVDDVKKDCNGNSCPPARKDDIDSAQSLGTISTIAFIAGGVGIGAGVLGLVLLGKQNNEPAPPAAARNETRTPVSAFTFRPELGPTWVGAHGTF